MGGRPVQSRDDWNHVAAIRLQGRHKRKRGEQCANLRFCPLQSYQHRSSSPVWPLPAALAQSA